MTGLYYSFITKDDVDKATGVVGQRSEAGMDNSLTYCYSVEGGAEIAREITKGVVPVIGSIYVEQYLGDFTPFGPAVTQALKSTDGVMIFDIVHLNKHLEDAGTGIRSILDSVVYRDAFPDMDREYLRQELTKLNLWQRTLDIETIADCWFQTGEPVPEELASMAEFIITAGSYGKLENRSRQRLARMEQKYKNPIIRGIVYWCWQFFKPLKIMQQSYPVLNKLQDQYRFLRFTLDRDGDINVEYDATCCDRDAGMLAMEMIIRITKILDEAYPELKRAVYL